MDRSLLTCMVQGSVPNEVKQWLFHGFIDCFMLFYEAIIGRPWPMVSTSFTTFSGFCCFMGFD